jgi:P2-related tail formation protein
MKMNLADRHMMRLTFRLCDQLVYSKGIGLDLFTDRKTVDNIKNICNSFVDKTKIITHNEEYYFELQLENINKGFSNFLQDLINIIEELKPAHLEAFYELVETIQSNLYIGSATYDSEIISTFPWTANNIYTQSNTYIACSSFNNFETIIVYPSDSISKILYTKLSDSTYKEMQFK